jgi:hypothetical protein
MNVHYKDYLRQWRLRVIYIIFKWSAVRLNLPELPDYDPRVKWVSKIRKEDGRVAARLFIYIDDFRPTAPYEEERWRAARKAGSTLNFLGLQEAARKCLPEIMTPGPWAGSMAYTNKGDVRVLIAKKKWDKGTGIIGTLVLQRKDSPWLDHKELERGIGFFIYLSQTYPPPPDPIIVGSSPNHRWAETIPTLGWLEDAAGVYAGGASCIRRGWGGRAHVVSNGV